MITYDNLESLLKSKGLKISGLRKLGMSPKTQKLITLHTLDFKLSTLDQLCKYLDCQPGDILEYIPDNEKQE